jgi:cation diffusion facilitator family transporter
MAKSSTPDKLKAVQRVFTLTLGLNLLVSAGKLIWGYLTGTLSLAADGFHSLLDAVANLVGIVALTFSMKPADHDHPYGHRKFEAIAAMIISFFIFLTCFEIAGRAVERLIDGDPGSPEIGIISYMIVLATMGVNAFVTWYEHRKGRELNNALLITDSHHTLSDLLVSFSVLASMMAVQMGFVWADTVIALGVAVVILKVGYDMIKMHLGPLTDEAVLDPREVRDVVMSVPGVRDCHKIRSRGMWDNMFIDLHIQVDPLLTVQEAHQISYAVEEKLGEHYGGNVCDVLVHVEEYGHHERNK